MAKTRFIIVMGRVFPHSGSTNRETPMTLLRWFKTREDGQDLLEYAMLASLIAIIALAGMKLVASQIVDVFWGDIASQF